MGGYDGWDWSKTWIYLVGCLWPCRGDVGGGFFLICRWLQGLLQSAPNHFYHSRTMGGFFAKALSGLLGKKEMRILMGALVF